MSRSALRHLAAAVVLALTSACGGAAVRPSPPHRFTAPMPDPAGFARVDLLAKHLSIALPADAVRSTHELTVTSSEVEGRFVIEDGGGKWPRLVMYSKELDMLTSGDVVADANELNDMDGRISWFEGTALPVAYLDPQPHLGPVSDAVSTSDNWNQMNVAKFYIVHPDGTLQTLEFDLLIRLRAERPKYVALAKRIARTVAAGPRRIDRRARSIAVEGLALSLPKNYLVEGRGGPDGGSSYTIRKLIVAGATETQVSLSFRRREALPPLEYEVRNIDPSTSTGTLLGRSVTWYSWRKDGDRFREGRVVLSPDRVLDVFILSDEASWDESSRVVESLRVAPR